MTIPLLLKVIPSLGTRNTARWMTNSHFKKLPAKQFFIAGTDTDVGKTTVAAWLCLHSRYNYFKPIVSGGDYLTGDSATVRNLAQVKVHPETYSFREPLSPHLAAAKENVAINLPSITLPMTDRLIVEGAGGLLVPLTSTDLMIDLIKKLQLPVILVASSKLGTINHTLLSLEALVSRNIPIVGVIVKGHPNQDNCDAIERYGNVKILAQVPHFVRVDQESLGNQELTPVLKEILT